MLCIISMCNDLHIYWLLTINNTGTKNSSQWSTKYATEQSSQQCHEASI